MLCKMIILWGGAGGWTSLDQPNKMLVSLPRPYGPFTYMRVGEICEVRLGVGFGGGAGGLGGSSL